MNKFIEWEKLNGAKIIGRVFFETERDFFFEPLYCSDNKDAQMLGKKWRIKRTVAREISNFFNVKGQDENEG